MIYTEPLFLGVTPSGGATEKDRRLVLDQPAAAVGEDGRSAAETRPVLLGAAGREPPDAATLRGHGRADRVAALARGVGERQVDADFGDEGGMGGQGVGTIDWKGGSNWLRKPQER
jgi:hypothetical protein